MSLKKETNSNQTLTGGRLVGFTNFLRVSELWEIGLISFNGILLCEMQAALFRIWTQIAESTSHDDNQYNTSTSKFSSKANQ